MRFNHKREFQEFMAEWKAQEAIMRQHGMDEKAISALFDHDFKAFKSERNFYLNKEEFVPEQSEAEFLHTHAMDESSLIEHEDMISTLDLLDQIENHALWEGLKALKQADLELFIMAEIHGLTDAKIAALLGQSRPNITQKLSRIKKFLKIFF